MALKRKRTDGLVAGKFRPPSQPSEIVRQERVNHALSSLDPSSGTETKRTCDSESNLDKLYASTFPEIMNPRHENPAQRGSEKFGVMRFASGVFQCPRGDLTQTDPLVHVHSTRMQLRPKD